MSFAPNEENDSILFGLGAISGINKDIANQIIENRPYSSFKNFYEKNSYDGSLITNSKMIALIKAGCFDEFEPNRIKVMKQYVVYSTEKKDKLTTQNMDGLIKMHCKIPAPLRQPYTFKKYVCSKQFYFGQHPSFKSKKLYWLDERALRYFVANCQPSLQEGVDYWEDEGRTIVVDKSLEKMFAPVMEELKKYVNTSEFLKEYNKILYRQKYNSLVPIQDPNHWSFETCSFFANEHELAHIDRERYDISL